MMRLLSWAWWAQQASSVPLLAGALVAVITLAITSLVGGAIWLHHEGAAGARAQCVAEWATAKNRSDAQAAERVRQSEDVAARRRRELLDELNEQRLRMEELEIALASRPKAVCFPKDIARRLNDGRR